MAIFCWTFQCKHQKIGIITAFEYTAYRPIAWSMKFNRKYVGLLLYNVRPNIGRRNQKSASWSLGDERPWVNIEQSRQRLQTDQSTLERDKLWVGYLNNDSINTHHWDRAVKVRIYKATARLSNITIVDGEARHCDCTTREGPCVCPFHSPLEVNKCILIFNVKFLY